MRVHFDEQGDAVYIRLDDSKIVDSEEVRPGIILDFDEHGQVVGIEMLKVKGRVPLANLKRIELVVA